MGDDKRLGHTSTCDGYRYSTPNFVNITGRCFWMMLFPNSNPYSGKMDKVKCLRNWMIDTATVLFDDNHNDLRALPKTVRLQLLVVLSFVWSTVFTVYFFSMATMLWGWVGLVIGHLGVVFAMYFTFKQFHNQPYKKQPSKEEPPMYDDVWGA